MIDGKALNKGFWVLTRKQKSMQERKQLESLEMLRWVFPVKGKVFGET